MIEIQLVDRRRSISEACAAINATRRSATPCATCSIRDICERSCGDPVDIAGARGTSRASAPIQFHPLLLAGLSVLENAGTPRHVAA